MTSTDSNRPAPRGNRRRQLLLWLALVVPLALMGYWLYPRAADRMLTLDGQQQWTMSDAPPRRQIIWQPAHLVRLPPFPEASQSSIVRPQLSADGSTLYFTLRNQQHDLDIYRSQLKDGVWQAPEPMPTLNSVAEDIGPALAPDGKTLYLYSDREGGRGGFDLYRSVLGDDGWMPPVNLGSKVNSLGNECEPAIAPDGKSLYFTSNQSPNMRRERSEVKSTRSGDRWTSTLRSALGFNQYNLYRTRRNSTEDEWDEAKPLTSLNRSDANDGSPFVDHTGSFLYFASDRPQRNAETKNLDIYRARIRNLGHGEAENLGPGINTPGHELEPSLSRHGFQIYFSRSVEAEYDSATAAYDLYQSTAVEVEVLNSRDFGRLSTVAAVFRRVIFACLDFLRAYGWLICLILLIAAVVASVIWYLRRASLRRASVPVFFVWAMVIHLILGAGSFFVYFDNELLQTVKKTFHSILVAAKVSSDELHQSHKPGQEAYEKVADLKSIKTVRTSDVVRQVTETPNVAIPSDSAIPQLPARSSVTPDSIPRVQVEALVAEPVKRPEPLERQIDVKESIAEAAVKIELPEQTNQQVKSLVVPRSEPTLLRKDTTQPTPVPEPVAPISPTRVAAVMPAQPQRVVPELSRNDPAPQAVDRQQPKVADDSEPLQVASIDLPPAAASLPSKQAVPTASLNVKRSDKALIPSPATLPDLVPLTRSTVRPDANRSLKQQLRELLGPETVISQMDSENTEVLSKASPASSLSVVREAPAPLLANPSQEPSKTFQLSLLPRPISLTRQDDTARLLPKPIEMASDSQNPSTPRPLTADTTPAPADPDIPVEPDPDKQVAKAASADTAPSEHIDTLSLPPSNDAAIADSSAKRGLSPAPPVNVDRVDSAPIGLPANDAPEVSGPVRPSNTRVVIGSVSREAVDASITTSPLATALLRNPARAPEVLYAEDNIGLQALLRLRNVDQQAKQQLIKLFGGDEDTLETVNRGLKWIVLQQHEDGHWSFNTLRDVQGKKCTHPGSVDSDTGATGFALLPLLGNGNTHQVGPYKSTVNKGIQWLLKTQQSSGEFARPNNANSRMYSHGVATIALCEAYAMSNDAALKEPAQRSIDFIVNAQHKELGGWRYNPGQSPDTSVVGWQIMALKSAQMANLRVPTDTLLGSRTWLDRVAGKGDQLGQFGYTGPNNLKPAMTAEALLCLQYLDVSRDDPQLQAGAKYLAQTLPREKTNNSYYWYYATQFMFHLQGDPWQRWNKAMKPLLRDTQIKEGHQAGTWEPGDQWENSGGRLLSTSLRILMLEVYFRHLPLYQITE